MFPKREILDMVDEENPGAEDELTLPNQKSVNNGGSVPPNPASDAVAQLNADTHTRLDRALDSASQANRKMEFYAKRLAGGAAVVVFLCAVLLMVAGGRLSGQVEALQAATLSITKRVVNMNSALDRMVVLDQKLTMLDEGQAQLAEAIGQVEQDGINLAEQMKASIAGVNSTVTDTSEVTRSGVESSRAMVAQLQKQSEQLSELARRVKQLESGFGDVAALKREVSTLIQIERDNLTDLFEAQLALQQAQMRSDGIEEPAQVPEKVYPEGAIVFPPSAARE
jgi:methyl-accepting chemotaxis protein